MEVIKTVRLNSADKTETFYSEISELDCEVKIENEDDQFLNAKSAIILFSMNLSEKLKIIASGDKEDIEAFIHICEKYKEEGGD